MLVEPLGNISFGPGEETGSKAGQRPEEEAEAGAGAGAGEGAGSGAGELSLHEGLYSGGLHLHHCADTIRGRRGEVRGRE